MGIVLRPNNTLTKRITATVWARESGPVPTFRPYRLHRCRSQAVSLRPTDGTAGRGKSARYTCREHLRCHHTCHTLFLLPELIIPVMRLTISPGSTRGGRNSPSWRQLCSTLNANDTRPLASTCLLPITVHRTPRIREWETVTAPGSLWHHLRVGFVRVPV